MNLPLLTEDPCIKLPNGMYLDRNSRFSFTSSLGADVNYDYQTCGLALSFSMAEGDKKFNGSWPPNLEELKSNRSTNFARANAVANFANSAGWRLIGPKLSQEREPLVSLATNMVKMSSNISARYMT